MEPAPRICADRGPRTGVGVLYGRINYEHTPALPYRSREFKLDRMRQLVAELGHPERRFPIVHVAGTEGKGSTSAMIARVLRAAGYRTGLYSSPHLDRIEERWTIDGRLCSEPQLVQLMQTLAPVVQRMDRQAAESPDDRSGPTYFEVTTAAAMLHFAREQVDIAVVESGLGGAAGFDQCLHPGSLGDHEYQL